MSPDPDAYDRQRDDEDFDRGTRRDIDELDALCGISEPWHDLDPEGVMWS